MGQEKKDIMEGMRFGGLAHVPEINVSNTLLIELLDRFDIERGRLKTLQGTINITPWKVAAVLGITNGDKKIFDSVKNIFLATLARNVLDMSVDNLREWDWANHVLNFLMKGVENKREGKKQTKQEKDNTAEKRKRALEIIREKRSKKRNNGAQSTNIAPDQFDSPQGQNDFSQIPLEQPYEEPTEQQSKQEALVDVNKFNVLLSLDSLLFLIAALQNPTSRVLREQSKEPLVAQQSEKETLILSSFDSAAQPRERKDERPSFSLGISPPASQPT
ncbi:hypothetical protein AHAS_Ahas11G0151000 [Arachis hypogaea]